MKKYALKQSDGKKIKLLVDTVVDENGEITVLGTKYLFTNAVPLTGTVVRFEANIGNVVASPVVNAIKTVN